MLCMFWRRLLRIAIGGVVCALLVLATGWLVQRVALGVDDAGMRMRVEAEVRSAFDRHGAEAPHHGGADERSPDDSRRARR